MSDKYTKSGPDMPGWFSKLASVLKADPSVCLAYLFGSYANGRSTAESDVDIGVFLYQPYSDADVDRVWTAIERVVPRPVDLVVINDAPPLLAAAAMQGRRVFVRDAFVELETWIQVSREAMDFAEFFDSMWREREAVGKSDGQ